jgi:hypothetical protein
MFLIFFVFHLFKTCPDIFFGIVVAVADVDARCFSGMGLVAILTCTAILARAVWSLEPGYGGRVETIENVQMTVSTRGSPVLLKFTSGTIGLHISKRAFRIELDDDHEACQLINIIFPDLGPCEIENERHAESTSSFPPIPTQSSPIQPLITPFQSPPRVWALDILLVFYFQLRRKLSKSPLSTITPNLNTTSRNSCPSYQADPKR